MNSFRVLSAVEQVVEHLRQELIRGAWSGMMPGGDRLAKELGIGRNTVEAALRRLEKEGLLVGRGSRRQRRIDLPGGLTRTSLRVGILNFEVSDARQDYMVEIKHRLMEAGHVPYFSTKSLSDLGMDVKRVARFVAKNEADVWVVVAASREVLEWFAARPEPAIALFGRMRKLVIAGAGLDMPTACAAATRELIGLGHRRIVLVSPRMHRLPEPGATDRACLDEMEAHGIQTGPYNLPTWDENIQGFQNLLESLFRTTPPTALVVDGVPLFAALQQFLGRRGIRAPEDVSLVSTDFDPGFAWCQPSIAHIRWDTRLVVRRIVRWVDHVAKGRRDLGQTFIPAEFVAGGSVGPVKKEGAISK